MIDFIQLVKDSNIEIKGVIHIGAYHGSEKNKYEHLGAKNLVWIEANPEYYEIIKRNVGDDLVIIQAVGNENIESILNIANNGQSSSILEFGTHLDEHPGINYSGKIDISIKRMVDIIEEYSLDIESYNFLNIDVQGYELEVMKGFDDLIGRFDFIYSEVNEKELYKGCPMISEIDEYLNKFGFKRIQTLMTLHGWGDAIYQKI
jgi:FkbM family methyltransferase